MSFFVVFFSTFFVSSHHLSAVICRQIPMQHLTPAGRPIPPGPSRPSSIQQFHLFFIQGFLAFHRLPPPHTHTTDWTGQYHPLPAPSLSSAISSQYHSSHSTQKSSGHRQPHNKDTKNKKPKNLQKKSLFPKNSAY